MKMKFLEVTDLMLQAQKAQRKQDQRFDVLLHLVEYMAKEHFLDDPDGGHPEHIRLAYECVYEWHNEILERLASNETEVE